MPRSVALPPDAQRRVARHLERTAEDLFLALDEVREHGGTHISVMMTRPGSRQQFRLVLANPEMLITREQG